MKITIMQFLLPSFEFSGITEKEEHKSIMTEFIFKINCKMINQSSSWQGILTALSRLYNTPVILFWVWINAEN